MTSCRHDCSFCNLQVVVMRNIAIRAVAPSAPEQSWNFYILVDAEKDSTDCAVLDAGAQVSSQHVSMTLRCHGTLQTGCLHVQECQGQHQIQWRGPHHADSC